ncbi:MAG: M20/M25/M40 family metallo-hydrolase [Candidatus Gastranaerophilales bacterium]|nr:M20/M25/M40 family metallo-hydrolase [Candidatus Gastranaerophilales bacterium]
MKNLRAENKLIDIFCELVSIPSPSLKEDKVADKILEIFKENNINAKKDEYGNIKAKIEATDSSKKSLLLSSHMDVVGDDSPVNINLNGNIIETDKSRTLGADDKSGVAAAILLAIETNNDKTLKHGGLEIIFTRDEEQNMTGIHNIKTENIESEYILVLDADKLGQVQIAGASYTKLVVKVDALKGGHSGIDIGDKTRLNAGTLIAELVNEIPQGVYKKDEFGTVTSINLGVIIGGGIQTAIDNIKTTDIKSSEYIDYILDKAITNVINIKAGAAYSIRSSNRQFEKNLIDEIRQIAENFNKKYEGLAKAAVETAEHLPPFEKSDDETIINTAKKASENIKLDIDISSFHAGAETHIYANNKNKYGIQLKPALLGIADIYNMHSANEQIDYKTYLRGYEFLKEFFKVFNS